MKIAREPNIGVKSSQNGPQMVPKWAQDGSKMLLNWVKNRSKFEIFPNWGQRHDFRQIIDDFGPPKGAQMSPKIDQKSIKKPMQKSLNKITTFSSSLVEKNSQNGPQNGYIFGDLMSPS